MLEERTTDALGVQDGMPEFRELLPARDPDRVLEKITVHAAPAVVGVHEAARHVTDLALRVVRRARERHVGEGHAADDLAVLVVHGHEPVPVAGDGQLLLAERLHEPRPDLLLLARRNLRTEELVAEREHEAREPLHVGRLRLLNLELNQCRHLTSSVVILRYFSQKVKKIR